jgi:large subunit ribosomal protein L15
MPHKLRKSRKKRGTRTVGWGIVGQHRGGGQRGGHGKAGRRKHLWSYILRYEPDYFKKKGFFSFRKKATVANVGDLEGLAKKFGEENLPKRGETPFLDLDKMGYDKLLGSGLVGRPFSVRVKSHSELAARKLKEAGGTIISEVDLTKSKSP